MSLFKTFPGLAEILALLKTVSEVEPTGTRPPQNALDSLQAWVEAVLTTQDTPDNVREGLLVNSPRPEGRGFTAFRPHTASGV